MAQKVWTEEDVAYLRAEYPTTPIKILAARMNLSFDAVNKAIKRYAVEKNIGFKIRKVQGPEVSLIDPIALMESRQRIGVLLMEEEDILKAKKLEAIYKSMNEAINKSL